jgi:hypothetical protein
MDLGGRGRARWRDANLPAVEYPQRHAPRRRPRCQKERLSQACDLPCSALPPTLQRQHPRAEPSAAAGGHHTVAALEMPHAVVLRVLSTGCSTGRTHRGPGLGTPPCRRAPSCGGGHLASDRGIGCPDSAPRSTPSDALPPRVPSDGCEFDKEIPGKGMNMTGGPMLSVTVTI